MENMTSETNMQELTVLGIPLYEFQGDSALIDKIAEQVKNLEYTNNTENLMLKQQTFYDKKYSGKHCKIPWQTLGVNTNGNVFICQSPSWIPIFVGNIFEVQSIFDILNSEIARKIRYEILNRGYYYCNTTICDFFSTVDRNKYNK